MLYVKSLADQFPMIDSYSHIGQPHAILGELYTLEHGISVSGTCSLTWLLLNYEGLSRMASW